MTNKANKAKLDKAMRYRDAVRQVLLRDWDPISVAAYMDADDEYDMYVWPICRMLMCREAPDRIVDYLNDVECAYMGLATRKERLKHVAGRLLEIRDAIEGSDAPPARS